MISRKIPLLLGALFFLLYALPAMAANTGDACTISGAVQREGVNTLVCNGSNWKEAEVLDTAGKKLMQVDEDTGACTADKDGRISYDATNDEWEYCDGSSWLPFEQAGCRGPAGCKNVGQTCSDGSVFAGCAGTDYHRITMMKCDSGKTYNGLSCSGTATQQRWANSVSGTNLRATTVTGTTDGSINTAALTNGVENGTGDSRSDAGVQNHNAAKYCADLSVNAWGDSNPSNGTIYSDWYLPAYYELGNIYMNISSFTDFDTSTSYWTSSEKDDDEAYGIAFTTGAPAGFGKNLAGSVRCVRQP